MQRTNQCVPLGKEEQSQTQKRQQGQPAKAGSTEGKFASCQPEGQAWGSHAYQACRSGSWEPTLERPTLVSNDERVRKWRFVTFGLPRLKQRFFTSHTLSRPLAWDVNRRLSIPLSTTSETSTAAKSVMIPNPNTNHGIPMSTLFP